MDVSSDSSHEPQEGTTSVDQDSISELVNRDVNTETDWDLLLEQAVARCSKHDLTPEQHSSLWSKIIECAKVKPDHGEALVDSCTEALRFTPSVQIEKDNKYWMTLIEKMYKEIIDNNMTLQKAEKFFNMAEEKFSHSFSKASRYWNLVRKCERQLDRKNGLDKEDSTRKYVELYKKQFSLPYPHMEGDYQKFNSWVKEQKLTNSLRMEVQSVYFSSAEDAAYFTDVYPAALQLSLAELQGCVSRLLYRTDEGPPRLVTVGDLCEEMIHAEPASLNAFSVYVDALTSSPYAESHEHHKKLFSVLKRALRLGVEKTCSPLFPRFLEMALLSASTLLAKDKVTDLVDDVIKLYKLGACETSTWFSSRKAVLIAIKTLIQRSELDKEDLKEYFQKALVPSSFDFCSKNEIPEECSTIKNFEMRTMQLFKQWILLEQANKLWTNSEMIGHWVDLFAENDNPITLLCCTSFVRQYGSEELIHKTYTTALDRVEDSQYARCSSYWARRSYLLIISDYLDYSVALNKPPVEPAISPQKLSKKLWNMEAYFSTNFTESYDLNVSGFQTETQPESAVCPSVAGSSPQRSTMAGSPVESVVRHMSGVSIGPEHQEDRMSVQDNESHQEEKVSSSRKGYPIFIANANFKATEQDIKDAFKERGIKVLSVSLKKNVRGTSLGYGTVEIATQEEAEKALLTMDRIPILGRATFLSRHRNEQKSVNKFVRPAFDGPTLVVISDLPKEWANPLKISNELAPYGHIKSIEVEDKTEPAVARVEYFMPGDCDNVIEQWQEGNIFRGAEVSLRKGFVGKKRPNPSSQPRHRERREPKPRPDRPAPAPRPSLDNGQGGQQAPTQSKPPPRTFAFVPQQVRKTQVPKAHMKQRLGMPSASSTGAEPASTNNHSTSTSPSNDAIMSPEPGKTSPEGSPPPQAAKKPMTNEDFKNMLLQK